jgi:hypothetical protein
MSFLPRDASFHERVQDLFAAFRGRGVSLSALDVELLEEWARTGAPFEVVARGIRRAAEGVLFDAPESDRGLRSLIACKREVDVELKKFVAATTGSTQAPSPAEQPPEPLHLMRHKKLKGLVRRAAKEHRSLRAAADRLLALAPPSDVEAAQWLEDVSHAVLLRALSWQHRRALLHQAREFVQKSSAMSPSARRESRRLHRAALLRRFLSLPALW